MECSNPYDLEYIIKTSFKKKFNLYCGEEYFKGDIIDMKKEFLNIYINYCISDSNTNDIN